MGSGDVVISLYHERLAPVTVIRDQDSGKEQVEGFESDNALLVDRTSEVTLIMNADTAITIGNFLRTHGEAVKDQIAKRREPGDQST